MKVDLDGATLVKFPEVLGQGKRLATLLMEKAAYLKAEAERRKDAALVVKTFDLDIARLASDIDSGQAGLFEEEEK